MRGIAAIGVMLFHLSILGLPISIHGYLAVDFFFMLSGFVLAHSYTKKLPSMPFGKFVRLRLIRIIPLSAFGLLLGSSYFLLRYFTQQKSFYGVSDIAFATVFNFFLLPKPWITSAPTDTIFPSNTPLWSLSLEVLINLVWALWFFRARQYVLLSIVFISAILLVVLVTSNGTADLGATWPTYIGGLSRVVFGFFTGVIIWRHRPKPTKSKLYALFATFLLACVFFVPQAGSWFDVVVIVLVFPAIIAMATCANFGSERRLFRFVGQISYPLYAIHVPVLMFVAGLAKLLRIDDRVYSLAAMAILFTVTISFALERLYDRPLRRMLSKIFVS
jgi:peptidoglycan/LPS O-acetylase OafA/YrhL